MHLNWTKCQGDVWCSLNSVNLSHSHFNGMHGVYIIWHGGEHSSVVYIGQGDIARRLSSHRSDTRIQSYSSLGLYVTWASVSPANCDGVERFLANKWQPKVGSAHPNVVPIEVNSPW